MRNAVRFSLFLLLGVVFLAASPAALGDESTYRLVTLSSTTDCQGFAVETIDGTVTGCVPSSGGGVEYSAAADGSIVYMASDNTDPSAGDQGSIWLVGPNRAPAHLDASPWDFAPTISYDGSKVVFARFDKATWSSDIYSVNSTGPTCISSSPVEGRTI